MSFDKGGTLFTGIVEGMGEVVTLVGGDDAEAAEDAVLTVRMPEISGETIASGLRHGDSVAINGVCLTATSINGDEVTFDVMPQTLRLTSLGSLRPGDPVNLERALLAGGRLDGHIVQGHVDGVAQLRSRTPGPRWDELWFDLPPDLLRYVCPQGSIAVAGVSLTVAGLDDNGFAVALIPTTLAVTTLGQLQAGDPVNIEVDILGKYIERLLGQRSGQGADS